MRRSLAVAVILAAGLRLDAQGVVTRVAILTAEDRRAPTPRDLSTLRSGLHNRRDPELTRIAVRALGRLERPELIPEIEPLLRSELPEVRAEAANAVAQAAQGWKHPPERKTPAVRQTGGAAGVPGVERASGELISRLHVETEPAVRGALCQAIGRMPYATADQVQQAESALTEALAREDSTDGRLGVAQGFESLLRLHHDLSPPSATAIASLGDLASGSGINGAARVRRLALEGLIAADALSDAVIQRAASDSDAQVRRLAMRAASVTRRLDDDSARAILRKGEADPSTLVRFEALRGDGARTKGGEQFCAAAVAATGDTDPHVALLALDQLSACSTSPDVVAVLERILDDLLPAGAERGWHRAAHALVALASAQPDRAKPRLAAFIRSRVWQLRMYAARAAATLGDRPALEKLAADEDDNVCEAALAALSRLAGHDADSLFIAALGRSGYQAVREASRSLAGTPKPDEAVASLKGALDRLTREGRDNSRDARSAIIVTLESLGAHVERLKPVLDLPVTSEFSAEELRRFGSARARVTIKSVGAFELALFTAEAPATVLRFAGLAQSGYYNGLTFHRVVPNFVIQGGSPGANEYVGDASYMRDEVGLWPHVRGAVGISTRGRDTGDAQIFIDLVDNPRLDHDYTVFAQVLSGMEVVDRILEGDVIEKIEIVTQ